LELWSGAMLRVVGSHLKIKVKHGNDPELRNRIFSFFKNKGIATERIEIFSFHPTTYGHLDYYNQVDIALDTFPYNGATTTLEALWMGVPVVSLAGTRTASRYGLSFLSAVNLAELAPDNKDDYLNIVEKLAGDPLYLSDLRNNLRRIISKSQICDWKGFAREIEAAYREMWNDWCDSQQPVYNSSDENG
jgi:protein O-GlcNAc transferase